MYEEGLIYRGPRIVNWDPKLKTNVSDDEVERKETRSPFLYFSIWSFSDRDSSSGDEVRDKYVVMHPEDERYLDYQHGQTFECEWINGRIQATIIKDDAVDPEFGTGVMTITPWRSCRF